MKRRESVDAIARAVLYEGYLLYPYRASALKNRHRFNFGVLYPPAYCQAGPGGETSELQVQMPVDGDADTTIGLTIRFLQLVERHDAANTCAPSQTAIEQEICLDGCRLDDLVDAARTTVTTLPRSAAPHGSEPIAVRTSVCAERVRPRAYRLTVRVSNQSNSEEAEIADRDRALLAALVSAHVILDVDAGEFISLLDPARGWLDIAQTCTNVGVWPVLVGDADSRNCVMASPIVLYDYPHVAPESSGDFFDGTEIDEILALRVLTLTDDEKREARGADDRVREMLDRTDDLTPEHWARLHGAIRGLRKVNGEAP